MRNWIVLSCLIGALVFSGCQAQASTATDVQTDEGSLLGGTPITAENASGMELLDTLEGHTDKITGVIFSGDGKYIATSSRDRTIKLWDAYSSEELHTFDAGTGELDINGIAFSPNSRWLITPLTVWDVETYETALTLSHSGLHVAISPDGTRIAVNGPHQSIKIYDATTGEVVSTISGSAEDNTFSLTFSPDGTLLAGSCSFGLVKIWNLSSGEQVETLDSRDGRDVHDLSFSPDGLFIVSGGTAPSMRLWDVASGQTIRSFSAEGVMGLAFSPDGSLVAAAAGYSVRVWDAATGKLLKSLHHNAELLSMAFSADGSLIAAGAYDGIIYLWGIPR